MKPGKSFVFGCLSGVILTIAGLVVATVAVVYLFQGMLVKSAERRLRTPPITSGLTADYAWQVISLDGVPLDMEETRGKAVFLHFWHPTCIACLAEIPAINRLYDAMQSANVDFVCIATGDKDPRPVVLQEDVRFPVYTLEGERPAVYETTMTPATFLIAPTGDIVFKHVGGAKWDDETVVSFLRMLAAQPAETP